MKWALGICLKQSYGHSQETQTDILPFKSLTTWMFEKNGESGSLKNHSKNYLFPKPKMIWKDLEYALDFEKTWNIRNLSQKLEN